MDINISNTDRATILTQAIPYFKKYYNKVIVVKYGGNAMINEELKQTVMEDIALLSLIGIKIVLVHGGGPEINDLMAKLGKKAEFVNGLRVTDQETIDIVSMVLAGKVNKSLVNLLEMKGASALGLSGVDGHMIEATIKDEKLGYVGSIEKISTHPIMAAINENYVPVIATVGCDRHGNTYNINGDTAAGSIAGALGAERLIMMTDIAGVLTDKDDPSTLIKELTISEAEKLIEDGTVAGGMIPKVECCIEALNKGVKNVTIMDGRVPHSILIELFTEDGVGTLIKGDE